MKKIKLTSESEETPHKSLLSLDKLLTDDASSKTFFAARNSDISDISDGEEFRPY